MRSSSVDTKVRERSYFVPKYVPASIIPDPRESKISEEHLIESMKKQMTLICCLIQNQRLIKKKEMMSLLYARSIEQKH